MAGIVRRKLKHLEQLTLTCNIWNKFGTIGAHVEGHFERGSASTLPAQDARSRRDDISTRSVATLSSISYRHAGGASPQGGNGGNLEGAATACTLPARSSQCRAIHTDSLHRKGWGSPTTLPLCTGLNIAGEFSSPPSQVYPWPLPMQ